MSDFRGLANDLRTKLKQALATKDPKQVKEAAKEFRSKVEQKYVTKEDEAILEKIDAALVEFNQQEGRQKTYYITL